MTSPRDDHLLVGAYAMDALGERDRLQFERHLARCQDCADELRSFLETTARLASAVPAVPPEELRRAALSAAARTRQLPPLAAQDSPVPSTTVSARRVKRLRLPRLAAWTSRARIAGVAAAMALLVVAAGVFANAQRTTQHRLHAAQLNDALVETVLSAPDATLLSAPVATGGTAHVVMAASTHACVFSASALRPLENAKRYELWVIRRGRDEPGGTIPTSKGGMVGPIPMSGIQPGDILGVSVEPASGPPSPTPPMIVELTL